MDSFQSATRTYFSFDLLRFAKLCDSRAEEIENAFKGGFDEALNHQCSAMSTAGIMNACSFMEATINELFSDAADFPALDRFSSLTANQITNLARYVNNQRAWNVFKESKKTAYRSTGTFGHQILTKYQFAAVSLGFSELAETDIRFLNAATLIDFRNKLAHYEPDLVPVFGSEGPIPTPQLTQDLDGSFSVNPFANAANWPFPHRFLSKGAVLWAIQTSLELTDFFFDHVRMDKPYEEFR